MIGKTFAKSLVEVNEIKNENGYSIFCGKDIESLLEVFGLDVLILPGDEDINAYVSFLDGSKVYIENMYQIVGPRVVILIE